MFDSQRLMRGYPPPATDQVTVDNMQQAPHNRWAFRHMRRLLPSAGIWRGDGAPSPLPGAPAPVESIGFDAVGGRRRKIGEWLDSGFNDGLVVLHRGRVAAERYDNGTEAHEPHLNMSVTKSFAGSLTGIAVERGWLAPADLVTDVLPELAGSAYDGAELRHVLDMTVGMDYDEDYENPDSDVALLDVAAGWRPYREGAPDNLRDYMATMRPAGEHGARFHYVSTNSDVLGWMLERASGVDFATLLSREIWQPMGAEFDAYVTLDRLGAPQTDGGLCVTTRDLARFGQLHLGNGVVNGRRVVPAEWIRDMRLNGDSKAWDRGNFAESMPSHHYRSQWYTDLSDPHRASLGIGIHGQFLYVDPVSQVVIAKHASHPRPVDPAYFEDSHRALRAIAHWFSG